jgi:colicin import membrane protein
VPPPVPVEKPDPHAAEIALKARQEEERRRREQSFLEQREAARKEAERREQMLVEQREAARKEAERRELDRKKQEEQKRVAEARERQTREAEALKAQAQREAQTRVAQQAEHDAQLREQQRLAQDRAAQSAALARAEQDYIRRIQAKVRGNLIEPGELVGNPEALFAVVQLPTGEIIDVRLVRSSGLRAYDDAVERAIRKSSPLPRPAQPEIWQRELNLRVRPRD